MSKKQKTIKQLYTRWGRELDKEHVLEEYPRPLLQRESYVCLNGMWDYAITKECSRDAALACMAAAANHESEVGGQICVPFSPETLLSGVNRQLQPDEFLWYRRRVQIDAEKIKTDHRLFLHFGAVDQHCRVYVNGNEVVRHTGGYLPFSADITEYVKQTGNVERTEEDFVAAELLVVVKDMSDTSYHARGKQKLQRGGMYYTAQSGIWQTVWMEYVPHNFIEELEVQPDADGGKVRISVKAAKCLPVEIAVERAMIDAGDCEMKHDIKPEVAAAVRGTANEVIEITIPGVCLWNCETPYLYYFTVKMGEDKVRSYFAMRTFSVEADENGIPRICLNHKPQFQKGVLDQGYWSDGLYTAPSDEALIYDIQTIKNLGFHMMRKHIKIEPQRWYYHCDRLGMVVWQDMVNGGSTYRDWFVTYLATAFSWKNIKIKDKHPWLLSRTDEAGRKEFAKELKETIHLLKGHPSIAVWVIFNEGWGQFATREMTEIARREDDTRLIDSASGWFDQNCGDIQSVHNYFFKLKVNPEKERASVLSEFGGKSLQVSGHSACEELYGYGTYTEMDALNQAYRELDAKVQALIPKGLCASVYTQVSDVEEEVNGILTFDREVQKIK